MSDFLARLAERALGLAPLVKPHLPDWFGPEFSGMPMEEPLSTPQKRNGIGQALTSMRQSPVSSISFQEREDPIRESRDVELVAPRGEYIEKADSEVPQARPPMVKMQVVTSEEQEAVTTTDQGRQERHVAMNIAIDKVPIGSLSEGRPVRPERSKEDLWLDMKEPGPSVPVTFQPPMRSDHAQAEPAYKTEMTYVPLVKEAGRQRKTEPLKFPVDAAVAQAEKVAPAIRVTIGRVDVRAVIAQAPPVQEKTTPAPAMTLDEYLKRRSRGSR